MKKIRPKYWWLLLGILYVLSPLDILPDWLVGIGQLDDIVVLLYSFWKYRESTKAEAPPEKEKPEKKILSPYEILGVSMDVSQEELTAAYHKQMAEYHPDKVNHLGKELRELAHQKSLQITSAYKELSNKT